MPAPEQPNPNLQPEPLFGVPRVTFFPEVHEVTIDNLATDNSGSTTDLHIRLAPGPSIAALPGRLAEIYETVGPGEYPLAEIAKATGVRPPSVASILDRASVILPDQLLKLTREKTHVSVYIGQMIVESAIASDAQRAEFGVRSAAIEKMKMQREKEKLITEDKEKIDLTEQDHMIVGFGGESYYFQLDEPGMILTARVIDAIQTLRNDGHNLGLKDLKPVAWNSMSLAERQLYTDDDAIVYSSVFPNKLLGKSVEGLLEGLTGKMGITRRADAAGQYYLPGQGMDVSFHEDAISDSEMDGLTLVYQRESDIALRSIPEEDLLRGVKLAQLAMDSRGSTSFDAVASVALLADITTPSLKRALTVALHNSGSDMEVGSALRKLHNIVRHNLGRDAHSIGWVKRRIGGDSYRAKPSRDSPRTSDDAAYSALTQFQSNLKRWTFEKFTPPESGNQQD